MRKYILALSALALLAGTSSAQQAGNCATDDAMAKLKLQHPEILQYEKEMEAQIKEGIKHMDLSKFAAKGTACPDYVINHIDVDQHKSPRDNDPFIYDIPVVVHVVHDFGVEFIPDNTIFEAVKEWNVVFAAQNSDTADVIAPFKQYVGNPRIRVHLATRDQYGNPTKGIVRHRSYLSKDGGDQAKFQSWPNNAYLNIWFVKAMPGHSGAAAYAYYPSAAQAPALAQYDGVISLYDYITANKTINHEIGHTMSLKHVWGDNNDAGLACGDDDVDDTPPTKGHNGGGCSPTTLYDVTCIDFYDTTYFKKYAYDSIGPGNTLCVGCNTFVWDYPDTTNAQNIMDYTFCDKMFTKGQSLRMHQALNASTANRNNLWSRQNLINTGIYTYTSQDTTVHDSCFTVYTPHDVAMADLNPVPDYSVEIGTVTSGLPPTERSYFLTPTSGVKFSFKNWSWNDTITSVDVRFSNGAATPTYNLTGASLTSAMSNTFTEPGWVTLSMTAHGNGGTADSISRQAVYVADPSNAIDPTTTPNYMEFNPGTYDKWPVFNYYDNEFKWQANTHTGFYDNTCMQYTGFDSRVYLPLGHYPTGSPKGDYDDFFSPAYNLSQVGADANLNFMSAGCFRTGDPANMKDTFTVSYSTNGGLSWALLGVLNKHDLANNGSLTVAYQPQWQGEWAQHVFTLPAAAKTSQVFFRFRYKPGADADYVSIGNNFFIDRINVSNDKVNVGVNTLSKHSNIMVAPNPSTGASNVVLTGVTGDVNVTVTDITGRVVYNTAQQSTGAITRIELPAAAFGAKGMYMVKVQTQTETQTDKLMIQ